jgi:hypothetical protein
MQTGITQRKIGNLNCYEVKGKEGGPDLVLWLSLHSVPSGQYRLRWKLGQASNSTGWSLSSSARLWASEQKGESEQYDEAFRHRRSFEWGGVSGWSPLLEALVSQSRSLEWVGLGCSGITPYWIIVNFIILASLYMDGID